MDTGVGGGSLDGRRERGRHILLRNGMDSYKTRPYRERERGSKCEEVENGQVRVMKVAHTLGQS